MASFTKMVEGARAEKSSQIIEIDPRKLVDDEENREIYNAYDVTALATDMKRDGFYGTIIAYPWKGVYKIESGHRRKYAAIEAGILKVPVMVSTPPKSNTERRKRLIKANLHARERSPMTIAREAQYLYETYEAEAAEMSQMGLAPISNILERVANDLEISISQVSRYRTLLKLSPQLQQLVDGGKIPWVALCDAVSLNDAQQEALCQRIDGAIKAYGAEYITSSFLRKQIEECSLIKGDGYKFDRNALSKYEDPLSGKAKKVRRANGASTLKKAVQYIQNSLDTEKSYIKANQMEHMLEQLKELNRFLEEKIEDLEENGFSKGFDRKL